MLDRFAEEIWLASGAIVEVMGFQYPTRMVVIKLSDGSLFVWSPVSLTDELRCQVDALGVVRHIIAPNSLHHLHVADWKRAYPEASVYAPPGLRKKRSDIDFDADLGDAPPAVWSGQIDQVPMHGNMLTTEVVFFHRASATALFADLLQQFPADWFSGWRGAVAKLDLMVGPEPSVPRKFRIAFVERRAARASLSRVLEWPVQKVVIAHGSPVKEDGGSFLRRAFGWLID